MQVDATAGLLSGAEGELQVAGCSGPTEAAVGAQHMTHRKGRRVHLQHHTHSQGSQGEGGWGGEVCGEETDGTTSDRLT